MNKLVTVWDLPLRLFHWAMVVSVASCYATGNLGGHWLEWHVFIGTFVFSLLCFRIQWGFLGNPYSRFCQFFPTLSRIRLYLKSTWNELGHSPLGAISVFAILGILLIQSLLGLFSFNDEIEVHGPFYELLNSSLTEQITYWHTMLVNGLIFLFALHISAIFYFAKFKKINLVKPMITGKMIVSAGQKVRSTNNRRLIPFLISIISSSIIFLSINNDEIIQWFLLAEKSVPHKSLPEW